jgi:hypothetical protein
MEKQLCVVLLHFYFAVDDYGYDDDDDVDVFHFDYDDGDVYVYDFVLVIMGQFQLMMDLHLAKIYCVCLLMDVRKYLVPKKHGLIDDVL